MRAEVRAALHCKDSFYKSNKTSLDETVLSDVLETGASVILPQIPDVITRAWARVYRTLRQARPVDIRDKEMMKVSKPRTLYYQKYRPWGPKADLVIMRMQAGGLYQVTK